MAATQVKDAICRYFGGDFNPDARAYLDPQVAGLGAVRRARGRRSNKDELHGGMGTETHGTAMLVHVQSGQESRATLGGPAAGMKKVRLEVILHVFLHSTARYPEDAQDAFDELRDRLFDHIHADPTLGSGGFEARLPDGSHDPAGFQAGEGDGAELRWEMDLLETAGNVTRGYLVIAFDADQYIYA